VTIERLGMSAMSTPRLILCLLTVVAVAAALALPVLAALMIRR
jgi:hypothetical protein